MCACCRQPISGTQPSGFTITDDGQPQCSKCDLALAKSCHTCNEPILRGGTITFDAKDYHTACFCCSKCHKLPECVHGLYTHDSKPYCASCHKKFVAPRCTKCSKLIRTINYTTFENRNYHTHCFFCIKCRRVIGSAEQFHNGKHGFICKACSF